MKKREEMKKDMKSPIGKRKDSGDVMSKKSGEPDGARVSNKEQKPKDKRR